MPYEIAAKKNISFKESERSCRAPTGNQQIHIYSGNQTVRKQWRKFLANGPNKENLVASLFEEWFKYSPASYEGITVFLAHGQVCHALRTAEDEVIAAPVPNLRCDHEEADTRMFLHAHYAADHAEIVCN